ncbi:YqzL family protein [Paenibacillus urinalis]|uniref:YqzL family protein n=1 Tax=Paenibacillus urinalis TaxID=521520 RepID=A0AAX3MW41_9BACL|nr:YqzL family protein [Paenibacillus urinalis]WDH81568.1 YqzL family protein [Paenibacillus urinalis]WDH97612.1 YqzL family protein [Paenibacillus urinalis]WDI01285.1 YqzL family protein [Paenibacillus urinalis]
MRDFSWTYFAKTGDVDAYLLYKESCACTGEAGAEADAEGEAYDELQTES